MRLRARETAARIDALDMDVAFERGRGHPHRDLLQVHAGEAGARVRGRGLELLAWYTDPDGLFALSLTAPDDLTLLDGSAPGAGPGRRLDEAYADLGLLERARDDRPYVIANMVATADGRATLGGRTEAHLERRRPRALPLAAHPGRRRHGRAGDDRDRALRPDRAPAGGAPPPGGAGLGREPLAVTATRSMELPVQAPLFQDPESHVIVLTNSDREPPPCPAELTVERIPGEELDLVGGGGAAAQRHGVRSLLLEGGPTLLAAMVAAGLVDELFLTARPLLVGGDELTILEGSALAGRWSCELLSVLKDGATCSCATGRSAVYGRLRSASARTRSSSRS